MRTLGRTAALAAAAAALAACASVDRSAPLSAFTAGRYEDARRAYEAEAVSSPREEALGLCEAGTVALIQGDVQAAHRHFREAFDAMEDLTSTTGETIGAIVGPESSKRWKGDPYERCMNAYYLGVTYWLSGDEDNAAASFKQGVLRDADSEKGEAQSDFEALWFLEGMAQRAARHGDGGEFALRRAHELVPANPSMDPARNADANFLLVLDVGLGPAKYPAGPHGAWVRFRRRPYRAAYAEVSADGRPLGRTARATEIYRQAVTRGDKVLDHVNAGKAVFKDAAVVAGALVLENSGSRTSDAVGAGLILAGLLTPAEADVRQWDTLPGEIQVLTASLPPGEHRVRIDVKDGAGTALPELSRETAVTVRAGGTAFLWSRAAPAVSRVAAPGQEDRP